MSNSSSKNDIDLKNPRIWIYSSIITITTLGATFGGLRAYKTFFRRIPSIDYIKPTYIGRKSLFGRCTSVGDGDNFRFYHTPGGIFGGWGLLRSIPTKREGLKNQTMHVRLAGIDAPEVAHFGKPAQPYSNEALKFLRDYIVSRKVRIKIWRKDQYGRIVATAYVKRGLLWKDISLQMLKSGMATIYEAKYGVEFGGKEDIYKKAEVKAKNQKIGMWKEDGSFWQRLMGVKSERESPREYKSRMKQEE